MEQTSSFRQVVSFIQEGTFFIIAGHMEPDGDCVGSQLALASALGRLGKTTLLCNIGPFARPEIMGYESLFSPSLAVPVPADSRVLLVDCSNLDRIGELRKELSSFPRAIIDHHATGNPEGSVLWIEPSAPSTTFLIFQMIEALGLQVTDKEAEWLFFGLCTDTGYFRHLDQRSAPTFLMASRLVEKGVSPKQIFQRIYGGKSLSSRLLLGRVLSRTCSYYGGKLLVSTETLEDTQQFGLQGRDSDMLYQLLQSVEGVEAIAVIRQESENACTVGLRSRDWVDVSRIASQFGGGGHRQAAGFMTTGTIKTVLPLLVDAFGMFFPTFPDGSS